MILALVLSPRPPLGNFHAQPLLLPYTASMNKPEVQPLHAFILGADNVVVLFFLGHRVPLPVPDLVAPQVERLDKEEQEDVEAADAKQDSIAPTVQWLIVVPIDVRCDDISSLHEHVVKSCRNGACSDGI